MSKRSLVMEVPKYRAVELSSKRTRYCVCVPVVNEGERLKAQLLKMKGLSSLADVIIVDGGSTDGSIDENRLRSRGVRAVLYKQGAPDLSSQLRVAHHFAVVRQGYDGVITMDGNDKDGVEAIPAFIGKLDEGYDFVQGSRFLPGGRAVNTPISRHLAVKLIHIPLVSRIAGYRYTDTTNSYRAHSRRLLLDERLQIFRDVFRTYRLLGYLSVKAPRLGFKVAEIPVSRSYPGGLKVPTKISFIKGNADLLGTLLDLWLNRYDPKGG